MNEQSNRKKSLTKERQQPIKYVFKLKNRRVLCAIASLVRRSHTQCQSGPSVFSYTCECGLTLSTQILIYTVARKKSSHSFGRVCFCSCTLGILIFIFILAFTVFVLSLSLIQWHTQWQQQLTKQIQSEWIYSLHNMNINGERLGCDHSVDNVEWKSKIKFQIEFNAAKH